jgi:NTP pyrophosphatase (non-canonical NTP hydrolase)
MKKEKSLKQLGAIVDKFTKERGWEHSDPNLLISSILIELGELAEHFQWKNEFETLSETKRKEIGYEFVDVIFYLLRLANKCDIDIEKYFDEKIPKLAKKYPINCNWEKAHDHYRKTGKNKLYEED